VTADPAISVGNLEIKRVETTKSSGLMIDESLDWTAQVEHISKKVTSGLAILRRLRDAVELNTLITIYQSIIQPYFDYSQIATPIHNSILFRLLCSGVGLLRENISS
jgi:hypothetical protein